MSQTTRSCSSRSRPSRLAALILGCALLLMLTSGCRADSGGEGSTLRVGVALYTQDMDYRPVAVYAYWNDVLLRISYAYPPADYNASEDAFDWEGNPYTLPYYADENGAYREDVLTSPAVQEPYKRLRFTFTGTSSFSFTRLALVDTETGEELIPDIQRAYYQQVDQVFGTHLEESTYLSTTPEPLE